MTQISDDQREQFRELAKARNLYIVRKKLDGELSYAGIGDAFHSDTLYDREYNINQLVADGFLELVPRIFPFEKEIVGKNRKSVLSVCPECGSHGVNMPLEKECGNCGYTETTTYYDAHTIHELLKASLASQGWVSVEERLPTKDDVFDDYDEVLTIQVGRQRPTMMKYWEVKNCPFTKFWVRIPLSPGRPTIQIQPI